jgi:hypothetical protein
MKTRATISIAEQKITLLSICGRLLISSLFARLSRLTFLTKGSGSFLRSAGTVAHLPSDVRNGEDDDDSPKDETKGADRPPKSGSGESGRAELNLGFPAGHSRKEGTKGSEEGKEYLHPSILSLFGGKRNRCGNRVCSSYGPISNPTDERRGIFPE